MSILALGRRGFLAAGGAVAGGGFFRAASAKAASRPITELGVTPDTDEDLSDALGKAIAELSGAGQAVYLPGGTYHLAEVALPERCAIIGVPGQTRLVVKGGECAFTATDSAALFLSGLTVEGGVLSGTAGEAAIENLRVMQAPKAGLALTGVENLSVSRCRFNSCTDAAIAVTTAEGIANAANLSGNLIADCRIGIALAGSGHVTGNSVSGAPEFGLRLGGAQGGGAILADGNIVSDCATGIGVAANEETLLVSLNLITGLQAGTRAAIRAFSGGDLIGPDLAFESSEAYLNLTVVGNVAR